jgi:hypothetical protein
MVTLGLLIHSMADVRGSFDRRFAEPAAVSGVGRIGIQVLEVDASPKAVMAGS